MDIKQTKCYKYTMYYIDSYPKTERELEMKLLQKGFSHEEIKDTISELKRKGFLDETNFADAYIYSNCVRKGKSIISVKSKLLQKGVKKEIIAEILEKYNNEIKSGMSEKIKKEIKNYKKRGLEGLEIIEKLIRKGYNLDEIKATITK